MLGTERERVFKFYFSRLQRNSRVNLIFSALFLKSCCIMAMLYGIWLHTTNNKE
jgi:hypothetical protein